MQVSLSGNLRTGETELNDTLYFLYAVRGFGMSLSYKFSDQPPLMDRYGNQVASFDDCDVDQDWYHPIEGHTWRYIGQIFNDSESNIVPFDKCKSGYWESNMRPISINYNTELHAFGKALYNKSFKFSAIENPTTYLQHVTYFNAASGYGSQIYNSSGTNLVIWGGPSGIFYDSLIPIWYTTGFMKFILTSK